MGSRGYLELEGETGQRSLDTSEAQPGSFHGSLRYRNKANQGVLADLHGDVLVGYTT